MYWIGVVALTGFCVGLFKFLTKFPRDQAGLFKEVVDAHVDYNYSIQTLILSAMSLSGGATLGPEAVCLYVDKINPYFYKLLCNLRKGSW